MWARGSGKAGVYIMPQLGGTPRLIAPGQYMACWAPDGSTIAVGSYLGGKIWLLNRRGQEQRTLTLQGVQGAIWAIDWSSANGRLMFVSDDGQGRYTISTIGADGSDQKTLLVENTEIPSARWAPRGDAIYYFRRLNQTVSLNKILVQPGHALGDAVATTLIAGLETDRGFGLSSDGTRLVYARAPYHSNLWVFEPGGPDNNQGAEPRQLTHGTLHIERPRISPDGAIHRLQYRLSTADRALHDASDGRLSEATDVSRSVQRGRELVARRKMDSLCVDSRRQATGLDRCCRRWNPACPLLEQLERLVGPRLVGRVSDPLSGDRESKLLRTRSRDPRGTALDIGQLGWLDVFTGLFT